MTKDEVVEIAARKLAHVHACIDLYDDRPELHDVDYWREWLQDDEMVDPDIDWWGSDTPLVSRPGRTEKELLQIAAEYTPIIHSELVREEAEG